MIGYLSGSVSMLAQIALAVAPLVTRLPRRSFFSMRLIGAVALMLAVSIAERPLYDWALAGPLAPKLLVFVGTLASCFASVLLLFEVSVWQAVFCCTSAYAIQNLASGTASLMRTLAGTYVPELFFDNFWYVFPSTLLVYPLYFALFARNVRRQGLVDGSDSETVIVALVTVFAVIGLDVAIKDATAFVPLETLLIMRAAHGFICAFILYSEYKVLFGHRMAIEQELARRLLAERERQYHLSRDNIEAINVKCHDIRHQIRQLAGEQGRIDQAVLEDINREVTIYESGADTGNEALDTILTEKGLLCSQEGITLSVMADGSAVDFLAAADVYSFFGNALDNAIEAVRAIDDPERRIISLNVERRNEMASVLVENCYRAALSFRDGLPRTTKGDEKNHGFGMRSMQLVAEHYGGTISVSARDGIFSLSALFMQPEGKGEAQEKA